MFLDRDGTLIVERELITAPEQVVLLPGVAEALGRLRRAGYLLVVVTNQSALASGRLRPEELDRIHAALRRLLAAQDVFLDGLYFSSDPPDPAAEAAEPSARRKPGAGMLLEAATALRIDLARSFMVGDQPRDMQAGRRAGCRANLLVRSGRRALRPQDEAAADAIFDDLEAAARFILRAQGA